MKFTQEEREMAVGAFLDVDRDSWKRIIDSIDPDQIPEFIHQRLADAYTSLNEEYGEMSGSVYIQNIAKMSDETLYWLLCLVGNSPWKGTSRDALAPCGHPKHGDSFHCGTTGCYNYAGRYI